MTKLFMVIAGIVICSTPTFGENRLDEIDKNIYLGQAYLSGNVYIASFDENDQKSWPTSINFISVEKTESGVAKSYKATFSREIEPYTESALFPSIEKKLQNVKYIKGDFFSTVLDGAVEEKTATYKWNESIKTNFNIIGFTSKYSLVNIDYSMVNKPRPLNKKEQLEVIEEKKEADKTSKEFECTTNPSFLDSAQIQMTFEFKGTGYKGRLSKYTTPGCAGHLATIYILDIMKAKGVVKRLKLIHYEGVI